MNLRHDEFSIAIAIAGLKIGAIKVSATKPTLWASGTWNPMYNDNRMFMFYPEYRKLITEALKQAIGGYMMSNLVIAGTSTSGIAPGMLLAEALGVPFVYIRDKPKDHGLRNQIEGIDAEASLKEYNVILIEDLISMGGSSASAVAAIQKAGGNCYLCISIFNYGFNKPKEMFAGEAPYNKDGDKLLAPCELRSLLYYPELLEVAKAKNFISKEEEAILLDWMDDQQNWGAKHGFPPVVK